MHSVRSIFNSLRLSSLPSPKNFYGIDEPVTLLNANPHAKPLMFRSVFSNASDISKLSTNEIADVMKHNFEMFDQSKNYEQLITLCSIWMKAYQVDSFQILDQYLRQQLDLDCRLVARLPNLGDTREKIVHPLKRNECTSGAALQYIVNVVPREEFEDFLLSQQMSEKENYDRLSRAGFSEQILSHETQKKPSPHVKGSMFEKSNQKENALDEMELYTTCRAFPMFQIVD
ncbi:hypothetical protein FDP41_009123 [Naegleria fowleri]|uniref:Uncharacterized protein n=1 Tax=Naegleria fowleri TaxID=5763 RepID=A0A6A5BFR7_NAEFO|nr:uncharacterized protein FDP41_009123 [Naegleria fowleri]KAF0972874.1 hypothetical protein FDP41_009123 [Naegleria fowleri]CAG4710314.1 unnamed protein product [Naegleria fowleri]